MNDKQKANLEALQKFYGMPFTFDDKNKDYICHSPTGVMLMKYNSLNDNLFGCSGGELLPSELRPQ